MGPHLIWAGVVLVLGVLLLGRYRVRDLTGEALAKLDAEVRRLQGQIDATNGALGSLVDSEQSRLAKAERQLARHEAVINALSAPPKAAPRVRTI